MVIFEVALVILGCQLGVSRLLLAAVVCTLTLNNRDSTIINQTQDRRFREQLQKSSRTDMVSVVILTYQER